MDEDWDFEETGGASKTLTSLYGDSEDDSASPPPIVKLRSGKKPLALKKEFNFAAETEARKFDRVKGLNETKLEEEITKYAVPMDSYEVPNLDDFEDEIDTWHLQLPEQDCTDESELAHAYHRINNYVIRVNYMLREAKAYQMIARTAYDHLMDVAQKVYPGTGPEKKGSASYRLQAFFEAKNQAEFVVETLNDWARVLDKMHFRLRDGMEHLRSAARVNRSWNVYGESVAQDRLGGGDSREDTAQSPQARYTAPQARGNVRIVGSTMPSKTSLEGRMRTRKSPVM